MTHALFTRQATCQGTRAVLTARAGAPPEGRPMHRSAYLLEPLEESRTCLAGSDQVRALTSAGARVARSHRPNIRCTSCRRLTELRATPRGDSFVTAHASWIGMRNAARQDCGQLLRQVADSF